MKYYSNPMLLLLGLLLTFIWAQFVLDQYFIITMLFTMALIGLLSIIVRPIFSFSILVTFILALGFLNVGFSWNKHLDIIAQGMNIQLQVVITIGVILAWICGYCLQSNSNEIKTLKREIERLQKVEENTGFLTFNEFLAQAHLLFTGMKRRKEQAFLVKLLFNSEEVAYKARIINETLSKLILQSIRAEYDIACHLNGTEILIFLNNTNENGVEIVVERITQAIKKAKGLDSVLHHIERVEVSDNWNAIHSLIQAWRKGEKIA
ncbi:hypothetical protein PH210_17090 [Paenibacillus sp. BSR1-1]|uniref:hypothetical protein n=1 Tax=Paenibacillus sp. BSR1-1 TaxID=3020845 RepID=UPI0025AF5B1A|nr:hypothetical protein [Paenibacillus sp. BSR1-1]MDN3017913.1 hypothetical protein [Paenibacillus sp. BSR1-1]